MAMLWLSVREIISGVVVYALFLLAMDFGIFVLVPFTAHPVGFHNLSESLLSLLCFTALIGLTYFLFRKLCHGARFAWWAAVACTLVLLSFTAYAFWFAIHYINDWERTDGSFSFFLALLLAGMGLVSFIALFLPIMRRYCGVHFIR